MRWGYVILFVLFSIITTSTFAEEEFLSTDWCASFKLWKLSRKCMDTSALHRR